MYKTVEIGMIAHCCLQGTRGTIVRVLSEERFEVDWEQERHNCIYDILHIGSLIEVDFEGYNDFFEKIADRLK